METSSKERLALQDAMVFLGAIASGTEQAIGESANSISYLAGVNLGRKLSLGVPRTAEIDEALAATRRVLEQNDYLWLFEPFQTHDQKELVRQGEERLAADLQRVADGAPLPAIGAASVCQTCEMRGLCRRDYWDVGEMQPV